MAIKIDFDNNYLPIEPTFVLAKRNGKKIGMLNATSIILRDSLNNPSEITFTVYKKLNDIKDSIWDEIKNFRLLWCREWDRWFEITVQIDEDDSTKKNIIATSLCQAELSQVNLYNNQFNTEEDIAREDYKNPTVLYKPDVPSESLLHRMLEKMPNYKILHVDDTIANIQRTFSFDDISIYDAFLQVAEEINCLFVYDNSTDSNGNITRGISVYDLDLKRLENNNRENGYGKDTNVFITADELAENIKLITDTGAVKNCFQLQAGDEMMNAAIRECNPNGSNYIWYLSNEMKTDMSNELQEKIDQYDDTYNEYLTSHVYFQNVDAETRAVIDSYNECVNKYKTHNEELVNIETPIISYPNLITYFYDGIDFEHYLKTVLMPAYSLADTTAAEQASILSTKATETGYIGYENISSLSQSSADNISLQLAKAIVDSRFEVKVKISEYNRANAVWTGSFKITNYSDENDTADTDTIVLNILSGIDGERAYLEQKMQRLLHDKETADVSITGLFKLSDSEEDNTEFKRELKKYNLDSLTLFQNACQACIDILVEQGITDIDTWRDHSWGSEGDSDLYSLVYSPYKIKLDSIISEIAVRERELNVIGKFKDIISDAITETQKTLDFQDYIGNDLWNEFILYRREDRYSNDNYVSDGLSNSELISKAREFIEKAQEEIFKSAELQHSISSSLKNLLVIERFKPFAEQFEIGNYIRIQINDEIYKLRLIEYQIDYDSINAINVEFSDVMKTANGMTDEISLISKMQRMSTSYGSVKRQAEKGNDSQAVIRNWQSDGMNAADIKFINENSSGQAQTWDEHGILCRKYDEVADKYDDKQLKILNSTIALTDDNWQTTKTAVGLFRYTNTDGEMIEAYGINGEVIKGKMLIGEELKLYNSNNSMSFDDNGLVITNRESQSDTLYNIVSINPNAPSIFKISKVSGGIATDNLSFNENGDLRISGDITATSLNLIEGAQVTGMDVDALHLANVAATGDYNDLTNKPDALISSKLDKPSNQSSAVKGQIIQKTANGSQWVNIANTVSNNNSLLVTSQGVYDYALSKRHDVSQAGKYLFVQNDGNIGYTVSDVSRKMDNPTGTSAEGSFIIKTNSGSAWVAPDNVPSSGSSNPITSGGVYNYSVPKTDIGHAGMFLRYNENGDLEYLTIEQLRSLLGINNTEGV